MWSQSDSESMVVHEFTGYSVKDIMINSDLCYVQVNHQTNGGCSIKLLSMEEGGVNATDTVVIRGDEEAWTLPKV